MFGLGNPGSLYQDSRHNIGIACLKLLAKRHAFDLEERRRWAVLRRGQFQGIPVVLAQSRTYMNKSGVAVHYVLRHLGAPSHALLVITDDMDLPLGRLRIRKAGGSGGHNGLSSIVAELGTQHFPRLRVGIGRPSVDAVGHVLGRFLPEEASAVHNALEQAADAVETCIKDGVELTMNRYN